MARTSRRPAVTSVPLRGISRRGALALAAYLASWAAAASETEMIPSAWLQETLTLAQAEARYRSPIASGESVPFGYQNAQWEALKKQMQPGDVLWTFVSSAESWTNLAGRAGIALVRGGAVIATIVTMMN